MIEQTEPLICTQCKLPIWAAEGSKAVFINQWSSQHNKHIRAGPFHGRCGKLLNSKKSKVEGQFT